MLRFNIPSISAMGAPTSKSTRRPDSRTMSISRINCAVLAAALVLCFVQPSAAQQQGCASSSTLDRIKKHVVSKATTNADYWFGLKINTPQYRMKDVSFEFESFRQIGATYAGLDCQGVLKMMSPPDVTNANAVRVSIKYVLLPDGGVDFY